MHVSGVVVACDDVSHRRLCVFVVDGFAQHGAAMKLPAALRQRRHNMLGQESAAAAAMIARRLHFACQYIPESARPCFSQLQSLSSVRIRLHRLRRLCIADTWQVYIAAAVEASSREFGRLVAKDMLFVVMGLMIFSQSTIFCTNPIWSARSSVNIAPPLTGHVQHPQHHQGPHGAHQKPGCRCRHHLLAH